MTDSPMKNDLGDVASDPVRPVERLRPGQSSSGSGGMPLVGGVSSIR